jgi:hypothetical protein
MVNLQVPETAYIACRHVGLPEITLSHGVVVLGDIGCRIYNFIKLIYIFNVVRKE